ncbi:ATP-binding protein [Microbacterium hominis]|uniref:AAA family ATPase n=1 Tax=Microbacterium hominis TaxID=162426 RepID=A0A7D4UH95_9MICO|nr:AAA family ATPase [Microbacterium hominis]QKJ20649.1 AAA family ATPase [Microbacterium hominis]
MPLVERDDQLNVLGGLAERLPRGSVVLIGAEAGAGKSALLREFATRIPPTMAVRAGRCDDLATPASFAPLWDMVETLPTAVAKALSGRGGRVSAALTAALRRRPSVLILDDIHWADEATVDLIGHLSRRIDELPVLLCLSFRSDEVDRDHHLRRALGEIERAAVRIELPALTLHGVRSLAETAGVDAGVDIDRLYARSGGNAFFVTELLANPATEHSRAVSGAVLARVASLPQTTWRVLEAAALAPQGIPLDLLDDLGPDAADDADRAIERGLLEATATKLRCRHDLVRVALAEHIPPVRRRQVHQRLVDLLAPRAATTADVAQVASHAVSAGDSARAAAFSLRAAERAADDGAHREAVRHLVNALENRGHLTVQDTDRALETCAIEAYFTHALDLALDCALELRARAEDHAPAERGRRTAWCSRLAFYGGDGERAVALAEESIALFADGVDPLREAYARWWRASLLGAHEETRRLGDLTIARAKAAGELSIAAHVLVSADGSEDDTSGAAIDRLTEGLDLARRSGTDEQTARAYCNLAYLTVVDRRLDAADAWLAEGLDWTWAEDLTFWWDAMVDTRAMLRMFRGAWDDALDDCAQTIDGNRALRWQVCAASTRAAILLRRDARGASEALDFADATAGDAGPDGLFAAAVNAEAAWTSGADPSRALDQLGRQLSMGSPNPWLVGGVTFWLAKIDPDLVSPAMRARSPEPIALELRGDRRGAAEAWRSLGCRFESAVLDGLGDDPAALRRAFTELTAVGAAATLARLRRLAHARGIRAVPRGARTATAADPDGLTPRQLDVLALLGERLTDAQIARRLTISEKTAGHHVSAILARLGVGDRHEAGAHARARTAATPSATGHPRDPVS